MNISISIYFCTLEKYNLYVLSIIPQGYNGASVISGKYSGVEGKVMDVVPQAIYIHCFAQVLNLVLIDCAKNIPKLVDYFPFLNQYMYLFLPSKLIFFSFENKLKFISQVLSES